jgi:hypothetical protein
MDELTMKSLDDLGVLQHYLGHESAGLQVPTAFALEEVALRANNGALFESFEKAGSGLPGSVCHLHSPGGNRAQRTMFQGYVDGRKGRKDGFLHGRLTV